MVLPSATTSVRPALGEGGAWAPTPLPTASSTLVGGYDEGACGDVGAATVDIPTTSALPPEGRQVGVATGQRLSDDVISNSNH